MKIKIIPILILCAYLASPALCSAALPRADLHMRAISLEDVEKMAFAAKDQLWLQAQKENRPVKLYLHWSAGHYGEFFAAYHLNIDADGSIYTAVTDLSSLQYHTYMRNSGAIGIALACGSGATPGDLGQEPPTPRQIEAMSKVVATLARALAIPIDQTHVLTHGEAGDNEDHIFPPYADNGRPYGMYGTLHGNERWDLAILKNGDAWRSGGDALRLKAILAAFRLAKKKPL